MKVSVAVKLYASSPEVLRFVIVVLHKDIILNSCNNVGCLTLYSGVDVEIRSSRDTRNKNMENYSRQNPNF